MKYEDDSVAFDEQNQIVWGFGGRWNSDATNQFYGWDVVRRVFIQADPGPLHPTSARPFVYDRHRHVTLLIAGGVWAWDGSAWAPQRTLHQPAASDLRATFDDKRGLVAVLVVEGNFTIWMYDPSSGMFSQASGALPIYEIPSGFDYDSGRDTFVFAYTGKLAEWAPKSGTWTELAIPESLFDTSSCPGNIAYLLDRKRHFTRCKYKDYAIDIATNTWFDVTDTSAQANLYEVGPDPHLVAAESAQKVLVIDGSLNPSTEPQAIQVWERSE